MAIKHALRLTITQPIDLSSTLESGQAFRWVRRGFWHYGFIQETLVALRQDNNQIYLRSSSSSPPEQIKAALRKYLRLDDNIESIYLRIDTDPYMHEAIAKYHGLRILRQDPWECLVSFICSANSNIPRISATMRSICEAYGQQQNIGNHIDYSFPSPKILADAGEYALRELKMGFRAKYVARAAERIASGDIQLEPLRLLPYQQAKETLMSLAGVGDKVADCVLLFSLDKLDACPIDRWVRRAIEDWYIHGAMRTYSDIRAWSLDQWGEYAGYAQQYLFHSKRLS